MTTSRHTPGPGACLVALVPANGAYKDGDYTVYEDSAVLTIRSSERAELWP